MKYRVKLSKKGLSELMQLRGTPSHKDPNSQITRNRGGLLNIGRDWLVCDDYDVDMQAIKNDFIIRKDGGVEVKFAWFDVEKVAESEGSYVPDEKPTPAELIDKAETELKEDAEINEEVNQHPEEKPVVEIVRCIATKADGEQCTRKALPGESYCKTHLKKQGE